MLLCTKCGNENQLGRVFCGTCGSKLDLSHMASEDVAEAQQVGFLAAHWGKFVIGLVVILVILVGLAFWPKTGVIGEVGTPGGARRVQNMLRGLGRLTKGQAVSAKFSERDINGFFSTSKVKDMDGIESVSVLVGEGYITVHVDGSIAKFGVGNFELNPKTSLELICVPVGGQLAIKKVIFGHLPMGGPLKSKLVKRLHAKLSEEKEWEGMKYLTEIKIAEKKISVIAKK